MTGVTMPTVSAEEPVRLRDVAPARDEAGGLDDRLDARVGEHAARDADGDHGDGVRRGRPRRSSPNDARRAAER